MIVVSRFDIEGGTQTNHYALHIQPVLLGALCALSPNSHGTQLKPNNIFAHMFQETQTKEQKITMDLDSDGST